MSIDTGKPADAATGIDRRTVLITGGAVVAAGALAACGGGANGSADAQPAPAAGAASAPATSGGGAGGTVLAKVADVPVGGGVILGDQRVVVTQPAAGEIAAFTSVCTHQGCTVSAVQDNTIFCACHGSSFSAEDGAVITGPATRGLAPVAVSVQGDDVVLG